MGSLNKGKKEAVQWIKENFEKGAECLDVGACNGKWFDLVGDYLTMDAIEIWMPNIQKYELAKKYRMVMCSDIINTNYIFYDLIIFGDVLEHMSVSEAQKIIEYARPRCKDMLISIPFMYEQGIKNGNPYEIHVQDDLTPELFEQRYPGFKPIFMSDNYAYYVKNNNI